MGWSATDNPQMGTIFKKGKIMNNHQLINQDSGNTAMEVENFEGVAK